VNSIAFRTITIEKLYRELDDGRFAVPKLQRAFVWNGPKAAKLLDSIWRGMPIGTVTIWDTSKNNKNMLRQTAQILPQFRDHNKRVLFVLDGQQRLSVIHQVSRGGERLNGRRQSVDFGRIVFRVTDGEDPPRFQYRKPAPGVWVPLPDVLAANWRRRLNGLTRGQLNRVDRCRKRIRQYRVHLIQVESESLDEARDLFIRINSLGTPLAAADKAFARASQFDLRHKAEETLERLPIGFRNIRAETLLQTWALLDGVRDVGERALEEVTERWNREIERDPNSSRRFTVQWDKLQRAISRSIDCLHQQFQVMDDAMLPSEYMIATLAIFFSERDRPAAPNHLREIRKWFWATAVGQRYSGRGFRQNIPGDAGFFTAGKKQDGEICLRGKG
jgi:hypothetical protein